MKYEINIKPMAEIEIDEAIIWYDNKQEGLGKKFYTELERKITLIGNNPMLCAVRYAKIIRMAILSVFPYAIHYIVDEEQKVIFILAVLHDKKNFKNWSTFDDSSI